MYSLVFCCILGGGFLVISDQTLFSVSLRQSQWQGDQSLTQFNTDITMQTDLSTQQTQRDLSVYDKAGPYSVKPTLNGRDRAVVLSRLRRFLWEHWYGRKLGHVITTFYSKEGEPIIYSFFIEPDGKGYWGISIEVKQSLVSRDNSKQKYSKVDIVTANNLERIELEDGGNIKPIDKDATREPQSYKLRLIDQKGNVRLEI